MDNITKILLRQDSTINWNTKGVDGKFPILSCGEPAVEIYDGSGDLPLVNGDIVGIKVGDGVTQWPDLKYQTGDYDSLKNQVDTNTEDITANSNNIETLQGQVSSLETTVGDSTSGIIKDISDLQSSVSQNADNISGNTTDIGLLQTAVGDEETRAKGAERLLDENLDAEERARRSGDLELQGAIDTINSKIPTEASSSNKLVAKQYVDDSISNLSANYLSSNAEGAPFATHSQLVNASIFYCGDEEITPQKNDYCTVLADETMPVYTQVDQAIYTTFDSVDDYVNYYVDNNGAKILVDDDNKNSLGIVPGTTIPYTKEDPSTNYTYQNNQWVFSKIINDNSFTTQQMSAINSGATPDKIEQIETNRQNIQTLNVTKQAALSTDYSLQINNQNQISLTGSLPYITTAPSAANLDGGLKLVVLEREPATRYDGYWYLITGSGTTTYTITNNLTNCTNSNNAQSIDSTESYSATLTADVGYTLEGSSVSVTMDSVDVTSTVYNNGTITISEVTGDIVITATAISIVYDVYNNLVNCTSNNVNTHVTYGDAYTATITANNGYTLSGATVSIYMGGVDITSTAYNNGVISIANIDGDISISVAAVESGPQPLPASYFTYTSVTGGSEISGFSSAGQTAYDNNEITDLILPSVDDQGNTIVSIGNQALVDCTGLTSITIPDSVTNIEVSAFAYCSALTITIPSSVTSIGQGAFYGCTGLTSITVEPIVPPVLGAFAFNTANDAPIYVPAQSVTAYQSATNWADYTARIQAIVTPLPVEYFEFENGDIVGFTIVGRSAYDNGEITALVLPDEDGSGNPVTNIGDNAFIGCGGLTSLTIPSSVISVGNSAFFDCYSLTSVTIGSSVTSIGSQAFDSCASLTSVTIPGTVTSIGNGAFDSCESLTSIVIDATTPPTLGGTNVFDNTNDCPIYVPSASVVDYQSANNWTEYASRIQAIPNL